MSAFFDTNVIVYALKRDHDPRHRIAFDLVERHARGRSLVISAQVLLETYNVLTRKLRVPPAVAQAELAVLASEKVIPSHAAFVMRAIESAATQQLSIWDALIVAAAQEAGCRTLYTEDLQSGRRYGDVEIVNPFVLGAHEPRPVPNATAAPSPPRRRAVAKRSARL